MGNERTVCRGFDATLAEDAQRITEIREIGGSEPNHVMRQRSSIHVLVYLVLSIGEMCFLGKLLDYGRSPRLDAMKYEVIGQNEARSNIALLNVSHLQANTNRDMPCATVSFLIFLTGYIIKPQ